MMQTPTFCPPACLRPAFVQTALASSNLRRLYCRGFEVQAERVALDAGEGRRTVGYVNHHPNPRGLVFLLHGWLGLPQSTYTLSAAKTLFDAGFSTARLTLPEHGEAVLLNREFIPITRHDFVHAAMMDLCARQPDLPVGLVGFSLGGNVALRIARAQRHTRIAALKHVFAISPAIDPEKVGQTIDNSFVFRRYFLGKADKLYREKLETYPELNYFSTVLSEKTALGMTKAFVDYLPQYDDLDSYFDAYRIKPDDFVDAAINVTILQSDDDPIVPSGAARGLRGDPKLERIFTNFGGHNGFFERFPQTVYSEQIAVDRFARSLGGAL